jgi:hypothetical protein
VLTKGRLVGCRSSSITQEEGTVWLDALQAWQLKTLRFKSPEKPTAGMSIRCEVKGPGSIHLDDFKLEVSDETEDSLFENFRQLHLSKIPVAPAERERFSPIGLWYSTHLESDLNEFSRNGITALIVSNPSAEYSERNTVAGHGSWFTKSFRLDSPATQAELIITAVNNYRLEINGRLVGTDQDASMESWMWAERYDVADFLKNGDNLIRIYAQSGIMPLSGLLVDCSMTLDSQQAIKIVSDESWLASEEDGPDKKLPAGVLYKFGEGNWANHVYVRNCVPSKV